MTANVLYLKTKCLKNKNAKLGDIFKARIINAGRSLVTQMTVCKLPSENKENYLIKNAKLIARTRLGEFTHEFFNIFT